MNKFQKTVLSISLFVLIVSLAILGLFLSKSLLKSSYPPIISDCPDYWDVSLNNDNNTICVNNSTINLGNSSCFQDEHENTLPIDLTGKSKEKILCDNYKLAKKCNIHWDGVSNNNKACELEYY